MIECSICKSPNHEQAVYCAECGQRLHPAVNSSQKLHSPLLDSQAQQTEFLTVEQTELTISQTSVNSLRPTQSTHNNLRSPLLDARDTRLEQINNKSSRLHSPVLDGPELHNRGFEPEDLDMPVEEYNSLRSPLLAAKVPLPEVVKPNTDLANTLVAPRPAVPPVPTNFSTPAGPAFSPVQPSKQPTIQSLFGPGTDSPPTQSEQTYKQFATSLFDQSPTETGDKPAVRSPRQTGRFTKIASRIEGEKSNTSLNRVLPVDESKNISDRNISDQRTGFKVMAFFFLLASLVCKFWYWQTLGAALLSSPAFLFDQIGQVFVNLFLLILILTAKL